MLISNKNKVLVLKRSSVLNSFGTKSSLNFGKKFGTKIKLKIKFRDKKYLK